MAYGGASINSVLLSAMKTADLNHRVIANNIANADTPHFSPSVLNFERTLQAMVAGGGDHIGLRTSHSRHLSQSRVHTKMEQKSAMSKNDFNQVDLEEELSRLADNRGRYVMYSQLLAKKYRMNGELMTALAR